MTPEIVQLREYVQKLLESNEKEVVGFAPPWGSTAWTHC
jgi:hypothetical protein